MLLYYLVVWIALGRNPALGSIVTRYSPPDDLSPAAARYITTGGSDFRTLAAVIAQLAARNCLTVDPLGNGKYKLTQLKAEDSTLQSLAPEELRLQQMLFEDAPEFIVDSTRGNTLNMFASVMTEKLQKRLGSIYFANHLGFVVLGMFVSFFCAVALVFTSHPRDLFSALFLTAWFFFCGAILGMIIAMTFVPLVIRAARGLGGWRQLAITGGVLAGFGFGFFFVMRELARGISPEFVLTVFLLVAVHPLCTPWLRRLTPRGRDAIGQIQGFRQFLQKAEQDRMLRVKSSSAPANADLQFLPYAIALDIREPWGDHLASAVFGVTTSR